MEKDIKIPQHVAIILDGNGRWAKAKGMPRNYGHAQGAKTVETICREAWNMGIKYLTVYAFSTENWKRPQEEVDAIMGLLEKYLDEVIRDAQKNGIRLKFLGDLSPLTPDLRNLCHRAEEATAEFEACQSNICLNYGGRDEIVHAVRACAAEGLDLGQITEEELGNRLYSAGIPDPDLVIRPSGEIRISNFLLWQSAYSEFYFTDVLWPDFTKEELLKAIAAFQKRSRRFGGV